MLALGLEDGRVMLVDEATGEVKWEVQGHSEPLQPAGEAEEEPQVHSKVAISPDGRWVASVGSKEENWKLWDAASADEWMAGARHDGTGACSCTVNETGVRISLDEGCPVVAHTAGLNAVAFSGKWLATGGDDFTVILWDFETGKAGFVLQGHTRAVETLSFSSSGARLATGSMDRSIRIWDTTTGVAPRTIANAHDADVSGVHVHFSPTNDRILASTQTMDGRMKMWDMETGQEIGRFENSSLAVFSPDGRTIATTRVVHPQPLFQEPQIRPYDEIVFVDGESGASLLTMISHHEWYVCSRSFCLQDGSKLAPGSYDGTCKVWDSSTGALLCTIDVGNAIFSVAWGRDWAKDEEDRLRATAFATGHHPWLGVGSRVLELDAGVVRMILDRV